MEKIDACGFALLMLGFLLLIAGIVIGLFIGVISGRMLCPGG